MRLRLLTFLPLAVLITFLLLSSASSLVSALESSVARDEAGPEPVRVTKYETFCDGLIRQLHALSHEVSRCGDLTVCEGSPLLCPAALDEEIDHAYRRLRTTLHEECGVPLRLIDFAWEGPADSGEQPGSFREGGAAPGFRPNESVLFVEATCGDRHDWLESATSGEAEPARYSF